MSKRTKPKPITPDAFAKRAKEILAEHGVHGDDDQEIAHCALDNLLCSVLESLGYGEGVAVYHTQEKWYA